MHKDRGPIFIVLSLAPLGLALAFFVSWHDSGEKNFALPTIPWPNVTLPTLPPLPAPPIPVPPAVVSFTNYVGGHAGTLFPGLGVGLFLGLVITGTLVDVAKLAERLFATPPSSEEDAEDEVSDLDVLRVAPIESE